MGEQNANFYATLEGYFRNGNPVVKVHEPEHMGDFGLGDIPERPFKELFFRATPQLWDGKRVLDLGCGGPTAGKVLRELYPSVDYTGVDIYGGEGIDIVADATNTIPFKGLKFEKEFDTISCFDFLPMRFFSIPMGNIRHLRRYMKDDGHLVAGFTSFCAYSACRSIMDSFDILEERRYSYSFEKDGLDEPILVYEHNVIAVPKKKLKLKFSL
ncbi:hypothetical protein COV19_04075 [Candidatus Woesearchaeota archaeon CG10_big_fil_rev_8_21_14_0_10_44_13]|nr:MAG: hypothetical protein COV19_04075 [Candidatus Woesearchaeota archaeon CG10_big_fil_rev_8_21_14_0_10_44_13]